MCLCCVFATFFITSCDAQIPPTFAFEKEIITLTKGDSFNLGNNPINLGEVVNYSCDNKCIAIENDNILARSCGTATIVASIEYDSETYSHSFVVTINDYSNSFYFRKNQTAITSLNLAVGQDYIIDIHNPDATAEVRYSLSNNKATFNSANHTLSPVEYGVCYLYAKLYKNDIELTSITLTINIEEQPSELSVLTTATNKTTATTFYANTVVSGFFKVKDITENNISYLGYNSESIDIDIDNVVFETDYAYIPFETQSFGELDYAFSYANTFDNLENTKHITGSIICYQFAKGINFNTSATKNLDESYSLLIAYGTTLAKEQAVSDGYNTNLPFTISTTNTNTNCTFDIDINNDNVSIIDNVVYPVRAGSSLLTIAAKDGSNISVQIVIKVSEISIQDIESSYAETTTVYLKSNGSYTIPLSAFYPSPAYCFSEMTFMLDDTIYDTDIKISEIGEYTLIVFAGSIEKAYTFNVCKYPDSISFYEASFSTIKTLSFYFNYGDSTFLSNDIVVKGFIDNNWVVLTAEDVKIEGNTINLLSHIDTIRVYWSIDESIFADYTF